MGGRRDYDPSRKTYRLGCENAKAAAAFVDTGPNRRLYVILGEGVNRLVDFDIHLGAFIICFHTQRYG